MSKTNAMILAGVVVLALAGTLSAQTDMDLAAQRAQIQKDRNSVIAANLPLTTEQTATFWPLYKEYRSEMQKLGDRGQKLITDYAAGYNTTLTDEQAAALLKEYLSIQQETVAVKQRFAPRFGAILPARSVMRFYQLESKIDATLAASLVEQIPLAK